MATVTSHRPNLDAPWIAAGIEAVESHDARSTYSRPSLQNRARLLFTDLFARCGVTGWDEIVEPLYDHRAPLCVEDFAAVVDGWHFELEPFATHYCLRLEDTSPSIVDARSLQAAVREWAYANPPDHGDDV